jgi:hypothetical protein
MKSYYKYLFIATMAATNANSEFTPQKESKKAQTLMLIIEMMYELACKLSKEKSRKNCSVAMK